MGAGARGGDRRGRAEGGARARGGRGRSVKQPGNTEMTKKLSRITRAPLSLPLNDVGSARPVASVPSERVGGLVGAGGRAGGAGLGGSGAEGRWTQGRGRAGRAVGRLEDLWARRSHPAAATSRFDGESGLASTIRSFLGATPLTPARAPCADAFTRRCSATARVSATGEAPPSGTARARPPASSTTARAPKRYRTTCRRIAARKNIPGDDNAGGARAGGPAERVAGRRDGRGDGQRRAAADAPGWRRRCRRPRRAARLSRRSRRRAPLARLEAAAAGEPGRGVRALPAPPRLRPRRAVGGPLRRRPRSSRAHDALPPGPRPVGVLAGCRRRWWARWRSRWLEAAEGLPM